MNDERFFILHQNCIPVKGAIRSTICDLQQESILFIPNDLFEILTKFKGQSISTIKQAYGLENVQIIDSYFKLLLDNELGFWATKDELNFFPEINSTWVEPANITNAIIDIDETSEHPFEKIFKELAELGCKHIQIRSYTPKPISFFENILHLIKHHRITSIEIITHYYEGQTTKEYLDAFCDKYPRTKSLIIHSAPEAELVKPSIIFTQESITSSHHCGIISPEYFSINLKTYTESLDLNSCLNSKIGIDVNGYIKNCPSLEESYGHIKNESLFEVILKKEFKQLWTVNKDQIKICQDCEFRYICTDCRAYLSNPEDLYSKPAKCKYNPYEAVWEE